MKRIVFLPEWYIEKRSKKFRYKLKTFVLILICINTILILCAVSNYYNMHIIEQKKSDLYLSEVNSQKDNMNYNKELNALKAMNCFVLDFIGKINYSDVSIDDKNICFETTLENKKSYYEIIKYIEDKKKYKIINIFKVDDKTGNIKLKVSLEVII